MFLSFFFVAIATGIVENNNQSNGEVESLVVKAAQGKISTEIEETFAYTIFPYHDDLIRMSGLVQYEGSDGDSLSDNDEDNESKFILLSRSSFLRIYRRNRYLNNL
jgi:hypothetical protein